MELAGCCPCEKILEASNHLIRFEGDKTLSTENKLGPIGTGWLAGQLIRLIMAHEVKAKSGPETK